MITFLCFFVSAACFAGMFCAPYAFEYCLQDDKHLRIEKTMRDPAAVGLQACEVQISKHLCTIFVQNLKGDMLSCHVLGPVVEFGAWIFSVDCSGEDVGAVWFWKNDELGQHLAVASDAPADGMQHKLGAVNLWKSQKKLRCCFGRDGVTVRKFFGYDEAGEDVSASATIAYNDLKRVVIGCGDSKIGVLSVSGV